MNPTDPSARAASSVSLSRRAFVKAGVVAAGVVAVGSAPAILRAEDKAGVKPLITGKDNHSYEIIHDWAHLPDGKKFGNTHAVIQSADGRIFIHNVSPTDDATCIFDQDGKFIKSWGKQFAKGAHGMDIRKEGNEEFLYLAPTGMHKVFKTTLDGEVLLEIDYPSIAKNDKGELCYHDQEVTKDGKTSLKKAAEFYVPTFIALPPNTGDFYVTDGYGSNYVHRYNAKGEYIQSWGGKGGKAGTTEEPGKLSCPHGIWCDTRDPQNPTIVVADRANVRLQWFTLDGKFIKMVTHELRAPCHFSQRGTDLLIPDLRGRVTIFDKDNNLITHLGDNPNTSQWGNPKVQPNDLTAGHFCTPHGATWDAQGNAFVVEWLPYGRVTKLKHIA